MGWLLAIATVAAFILSMYLLDRSPNLSLVIAIIIPFGCYFVLGRLGGEVIFTLFAAIFVVVMNLLNRSSIED